MLVSSVVMNLNAAQATNSAFAGMMAKQSLMSLANQTANMTAGAAGRASFGNEFLSQRDLRNILRQEQKLTFGMRNNELIYKISSLQYDAWKKIQKADIERTFSTFA
jgi:hypothetical protein